MSQASTAAEAQEKQSLPLFFRKPMPLDKAHHGKSALMPVQDFSFARDTNSLLINATEFAEAAKCYPIVFTQDELPFPTVILGLEQQNYFVDEKGAWMEGTYIPAYVRKYPFVFMEIGGGQQFVLCIDEGAAQYRKNGGKGAMPFYDGDNASALTKNAFEFCASYQRDHVRTRSFCEDLRAADLLAPNRSTAKLANGREIRLAGFQIINEEKLNALPDDKVLEFHKKGWMPLIYFSLMATSNWKRLADLAGKRETQ